MLIREATLSDVTAMVHLGAQFHEESKTGNHIPLDKDSLATSIRRQIRAPNAGVILLDKGGEVVGGAALGVMRNYFNNGILVGIEQFFWISPGHRGSLGLRLIRGLEDKARELGCTRLVMISLEALNPEAVGRFYRRLGYECLEHTYIKTLEPRRLG